MKKTYKVELPIALDPSSYAQEFISNSDELNEESKHQMLLVFAQYSPPCATSPYYAAFQSYCYANSADRYSWGYYG